MMEQFCILNVMVVTWIDAYGKISQIIYTKKEM